MDRLDIYICTKSKCSAKSMQVKLYSADSEARSYNGPGLLAAVRAVVAAQRLADAVAVHETDCQSGCPVGPRMGRGAQQTPGDVFSAQKADR